MTTSGLFDRLRKSVVLKALSDIAKRLDLDIYLVGGGVRDLILTGSAADMDFAVEASVEEVAGETASLLGGTLFPLGRERNCYRVAFRREGRIVELDFSSFKGKDIVEDLKKRDFTINAIAVPVAELFERDVPGMIDPLGGIGDLHARKLRLVSTGAIDEDPLRILRGFRLAAQFSLKMCDDFLRPAAGRKSMLKRVSPERIRTELFKTFQAEASFHSLEIMAGLGILQEIIPEMSSWNDLDQGERHRFRLLKHSLETLRHLESILREGDPALNAYHEEISVHLDEQVESGINRRAMLKFAALMHDSGKPSCFGEKGGRVTFYGHEEVGADINRKIAARLKIGRLGGRIISNITRQHMRVLHLSRAERLTTRAMDRFIRDSGDETAEVLLLALADAWATRDARDVEFTDVEKVVEMIMERYCERREEPRPLLGGKDVMDLLGIGEGPLVGRYLTLLREEELAGRIGDREEAVEFLLKAHRDDMARRENRR